MKHFFDDEHAAPSRRMRKIATRRERRKGKQYLSNLTLDEDTADNNRNRKHI